MRAAKNRNIIIICLLSFFDNKSFAQIVKLNSGVNVSEIQWVSTSIYGDSYRSFNNKAFRPYLGIEFEYFNNKLYSLSSQIGYYETGGKTINSEKTNPLIRFELKNDLFSVPYIFVNQQLNLYPFKRGANELLILMGVQFEMIPKSSLAEGPLNFLMESRMLNRANLGFMGGLGAIRELSPRLNITFKGSILVYAFPLAETELNEVSLPVDFQDVHVKQKSMVFNFSVGYKIFKNNRLK